MIAGLISIILFSLLVLVTLWKRHPVLFQMAAGVSIIAAMYMPDILTDGVTNEFSVAFALAFIMVAYLCLAMAFGMIFVRAKGDA